MVDDPDAHGEDGDEGEEEGGAEPVDCGGGDVVVGGRVADDGGVGEPLESYVVSLSVVTNKEDGNLER